MSSFTMQCMSAVLAHQKRACVDAGLNGKEAIARSREVVQPLRRAMGLPFLGLIVLAKIMSPLRLAVLARLPQRYYWDLPEIPLAAYIAITLFGVTMQRCDSTVIVGLYIIVVVDCRRPLA